MNNLNGFIYWILFYSKIHKHNRFDFLETNLLPSLKTTQQNYLKSIDTYQAKFTENKDRLREVRAEKAKKREKELESKNSVFLSLFKFLNKSI